MPHVVRHYLTFDNPIGLEGEFCTFRLRGTWFKKLKVRNTVYLCDNKAATVIGKAKVTALCKGTLLEMAYIHGAYSHLEEGKKVRHQDAAKRRLEGMKKIYGPHRCADNSIVTVIYLKRTA
jgi:hypothetical protein